MLYCVFVNVIYCFLIYMYAQPHTCELYICIYIIFPFLNKYIHLEVTGFKILRYMRKLCIKSSDILFSRGRSFLKVLSLKSN
jgi:hypothetical protein